MDKPPPTEAHLKEYWSAYAPTFTKFLTRQTDVSAFQLVTQLQVHKENVRSVVEVGSGAGGGTQLIVQQVRPGTKVVALDLSPAFLDVARKRLEGHDVEFYEASAEDLPLPDGSFDRYVANFVLHLVTNPEQMLREARRVLKPGGVAGFSMWGRPENSPFWTLTSAVLNELGIGQEQTLRSNFHLGVDPEKVKKMALDAGFSRTIAWYSVAPAEAADTAEAVDKYLCGPQLSKMLANLEEVKKKLVIERLTQTIEEQFYSQGKPLVMETLYLVAYT